MSTLVLDTGSTGVKPAIITGDNEEIIRFPKLPNTGSLTSWFAGIDQIITDEVEMIVWAAAGTFQNGIVIQSPNLHFLNGVNIVELTEKRYQRTCEVNNDVYLAGIGAKEMLDAQSNFWLANFGGGLAARLCRDPFGIVSNTAELGHLPALLRHTQCLHNKIRCGCGLDTCAEAHISGSAMIRRVQEALHDQYQCRYPANMDFCAYLDQEYDKGAPWAKQLYHQWADETGYWLSMLLLFCPEVSHVYYRGTFAYHAFERQGIKAEVFGAMQEYIMPGLKPRAQQIQIEPVPGKPGDDVVVGAYWRYY